MRYIDADKLHEHITTNHCGGCGIYNGEICCSCPMNDALIYIDDAPTADIVPKSEVEELKRENESLAKTVNEASELIRKQRTKIDKVKAEVAKEIFEEIEVSIAVHAFTSKSEDYADGMYDAIEWVDSKIAELKKKYTGEV